MPCANSYEQSQLQPKSLYCNQSWKNSITYAKYMWKICVRIGMCRPSGRGYVHRRARRGEKLKKIFSLATSPPKGSNIYIHTHYVCFSSFLFPGNLHDSLEILWQPLRKSDNLCGSLAIPSQVYEHKGSNMM